MATSKSKATTDTIEDVTMTVHSDQIPDYIRWLHRCAHEGSANQYGRGAAGFVIHDTDAIVQPGLKEFRSVILHYKTKERSVVL